MTEVANSIDFLTIIAKRQKKEELLEFLLSSGGHLIDVVYAKGTVKTGFFDDMMGLVPEEKKVMITCLVAGNNSDYILEMLNTQFKFDQPNTGIAFIVPVDVVSM